MSTPVLFLIFNRPDLTTRVFERIRDYRPTKLYVAADGARITKTGEADECELSRAATEKIDWPCEVHRLYRDENLGCKTAVSSAITWFFEEVESGIILEDDCLPTRSFFRFCAELLERYRDDDEVAIISGINQLPSGSTPAHSYYFSKYPRIWGWATWRKVWKEYDVTLKSWTGRKKDLTPFFAEVTVRDFWASHFTSVKSGHCDTWDFQLVYLCVTSKRRSINPTTCLITNIGFDERATHTVTTDSLQANPVAGEITFPLSHPLDQDINREFDRIDELLNWRIPSSRFKLHCAKTVTSLRMLVKKIIRQSG